MSLERRDHTYNGYDGAEIELYSVEQTDGKKHGSVIVVHEIWGLEKNIRSIADRFAELGYNAYAPHLFSRFGRDFTAVNIESAMGKFFSIPENERWGPSGMEKALKNASEAEKGIILRIFQSRGDTTQTMIKDLVSLREYVISRESSNGDKVGTVGFCLGGGLVFQLAVEAPITATSVFYGANPDPVESIDKITGEIIASYGSEDARVNAGIPAMMKAFVDAKKQIDVKIYDKSQHAFFNDLRPTFNKIAADDAWERTKALYSRNLE